MSPPRPLMRYHGGKWKLADWIISYFPEHRIYVEPYGGGGSVLLKKNRSYAEIYNDLDSEVVNVFRVARDKSEQLENALYLTPFSRDEFIQAYQPSEDDVEQARRTVIRSFMGFGSSAVTKSRHTTTKFSSPNTGFRSNSNRSGTTPAHDWANYAECFHHLIDRLRGIVIENRDAMEVMSAHDSEETLHYVDPPYVFSTRDAGSDYKYELDNSQHVELLEFLKTLKGFVILSGYKNEIYEKMLPDWLYAERAHRADGAAKRTECLWISPNTPIPQEDLFSR